MYHEQCMRYRQLSSLRLMMRAFLPAEEAHNILHTQPLQLLLANQKNR